MQTCNVPWCLGVAGIVVDDCKSVRVKFEIRSTLEGLAAHGKIYRLKQEDIINKIVDTSKSFPIGVDHENSSTKYKEFVEEFQNINAGDYLILMVYATGKSVLYNKNFSIMYDLVCQ